MAGGQSERSRDRWCVVTSTMTEAAVHTVKGTGPPARRSSFVECSIPTGVQIPFFPKQCNLQKSKKIRQFFV